MRNRRALVLGWRGGVGTALLRLLGTHQAARPLVNRLETVILSGPFDPPLDRLLVEHRINQVVEVGDVDTLATSAVCARHGADYVSAAMQKQGDGDDALTMVAAQSLLPGRRPAVGDASHLIGAGMNPGVVNALVYAGLEALAARTGAAPTVEALELYAIHVTEEDTTRRVGAEPGDEFPMSWSPHHALAEILEPRAMYVAGGRLATFGHRPHDRDYAVRCGDREVAAMVVPHEELVTIGIRHAPVECAFAYAIPEAARTALRREPDRPADEWPIRRLYPPETCRLTGRDRVGVLLCSRRHGELWIGFDTDVSEGSRYGSNATLLQAAAGVLAGWSLLGTHTGVHVVEELDWREYLAIVEGVLGPHQVHHAPEARPRTLAERRVG